MVRFAPGQVLSAEWDGDGTWRVVHVLAVAGDEIELRVHPERFPGPPAAGALVRLDRERGERHRLGGDELRHMAPIAIVSAPEHGPDGRRSTRRGLLAALLRRGGER